MRLELGSVVHCTDPPFGELADVVVDPVSRRVTHLVVQPHDRHDRARLVPVERASAAGDDIALDCSVADVEALEPVHESAYLRVGRAPRRRIPDWEIGTQDVLALPLYQEMDGMGTVIDPDPHVIVNYDRIPKHEVEIRRSSAVMSADGHRLGHVDGFLVGQRRDGGHRAGARSPVGPARDRHPRRRGRARGERLGHLERDQGRGRGARHAPRPPLVLADVQIDVSPPAHQPSVPRALNGAESSESRVAETNSLVGSRAAGPRHRVLERTCPYVLEEDDGHRFARRELRAEVAQRRARVAAQRALGGAAASVGVQAELDERRDEPAGSACAYLDGAQLAGLGVALEEERVEDAQRAAALDPLQSTDQLALELGVRAEPVEQELGVRERRVSGHGYVDDPRSCGGQAASSGSDDLSAGGCGSGFTRAG